jgi:small-conductance mechanosensitive channel
MFLLLEHPFKVGDWIEVDDVSGYVHSVELLSTYIRTFDNRLIRIPNETVSKSKLTNFTKYAIRRLDLDIRVSCKEDARKVMRIFREVVIANPACFNEPEPLIVFKGFGDASLDFLLAVWTDRNEMQSTRTSLMQDIKERFDREGIELPYERLATVEERAKVGTGGEKRS